MRGVHAQPLGRTRGEYSCEASLTMLLEEANDFLQGLGNGYMEQSFDLAVTYAEQGASTRTDEVRGCRITSIAHSHASGTEGLTVEITLMPLYIVRDGHNPLVNMLSGSSAPGQTQIPAA